MAENFCGDDCRGWVDFKRSMVGTVGPTRVSTLEGTRASGIVAITRIDFVASWSCQSQIDSSEGSQGLENLYLGGFTSYYWGDRVF